MAPAQRAPADLTGPRPDLTTTGRCQSSCSAGSSKIKIWTSSRHKARRSLYGDEVRILIFDDPGELGDSQRPVIVRSGRGPVKPARAPRTRHAWRKFTKIYGNPRSCATRALSIVFLLVKSTVSPDLPRFITDRQIEHASQIVEFANDRFRLYSIQR